VRNGNDAISLIQTAEGATEQITNMLQRMRELSIQSSNDTNNTQDRKFLDFEFQQLKAEIDRIGMNTQWNGKNILDGTAGNNSDGVFSFQIGANANQIIQLKLPDLQTAPKAPLGFPTNNTTPSAPTVDLSALDVDPSKQANSVVKLSVDGHDVSYTVSSTDVANAMLASGDPSYVPLSTAVAAGLSTRFAAASLPYTVAPDANTTSQLNVSSTDPNSTAPINVGVTGGVLPPFANTGSSGAPVFDLHALDSHPPVQLGVVIQATVDGKAVQYKITQDDIDHVTGTGSWDPAVNPAHGGTQPLSTTVRNALVGSLNTAFLGTTFQAASSGASSLNITDSNGTQDFTTSVAPVEGSLSSIDPSANILTGTAAYQGIALIDEAMQKVNEARSSMGAVVSRLQFAVDNLFNVSAKATESRSRIEDTDYSMATTELAKRNIIQQAAQAMLAQANQQPQMVLQLLK
jgi:flagellin